MKTTDSRDPLDRKIDELLKEPSVRPSDDFIARTLAAAEAVEQKQPAQKRSFNIVPFTLPIAAVLAMALFLSSQLKTTPTEVTTNETPQIAATEPVESLDDYAENADIQEILLLQEGLSGLASIESSNFEDGDLLQALDTLYFDIES